MNTVGIKKTEYEAIPVILAIDTSCDETSVAVTRGVFVLANVIASQAELHKQYGGVFPTVAKQAHIENIEPCVNLALKRAKLTWDEVSAIAVTQGPGLAPALEIGIRYAEKLAKKYTKPLIPVNHIEGHIVSVLAKPLPRSITSKPDQDEFIDTATKIALSAIKFPVVSLIISGGHTEFILIDSIGSYKKLGWTIDDAAGEALDKIGRMLNFGYPAGPVIEQFAKKGDSQKYRFPLPMTTSGDFNVSFSGLKTFARNLTEVMSGQGSLDNQVVSDIAASAQYSIFRHILHKLSKLLNSNHSLGEVWLGGGVAANTTLRVLLRTLLRKHSLPLRVPYTKKLCGDNAAMIGIAAQFHSATTSEIDRKPRWDVGLV